MKHTLKRVLAMGTALVLTLGLSTAALAAEEGPRQPRPRRRADHRRSAGRPEPDLYRRRAPGKGPAHLPALPRRV